MDTKPGSPYLNGEEIYVTLDTNGLSFHQLYDEVCQEKYPPLKATPCYKMRPVEEQRSNNISDTTAAAQMSNCVCCCDLFTWFKVIIMIILISVITVVAVFLWRMETNKNGGEPNVMPDYVHQDWFVTTWNPTDDCAVEAQVNIVKFEPLKMDDEDCDDQKSCVKLIAAYKCDTKPFAKYSFYIDSDGTVYSGRAWGCQYISGELWVAVLDDDFKPNSSKANQTLNHFNTDVTGFGVKNNYFVTSYKRDYLDDYCFDPDSSEGCNTSNWY